ncbi:unnamed protein product [Phytomonas sp. EM1]|nr:unnamed protein product [Phytomonas sp. EM1]|eukprot:CCW64149.1 unnamed protein product [Phytomonas sp. isolate EM1]
MRELTRQITVLCPERGLLLNELCERMAHSTEMYKVLYESACQYAVRKATERDLQSHLYVEKKALEGEVRRVENRVNELQAKYDGMVKRFQEQMDSARHAHEVDIEYVKKSNQQIITEIKRLASMESASK